MAKGNSNSLNNKSSSSKPYDVTNSFVKQVKDRMTSYLPRFGLFSPPIVANESEIVAPAATIQNDSSSEDDESSSQQFAPPKKRARSDLNQPLPFENIAASTPNNQFYNRVPAHDLTDGTIAGPSGISRRPCLASSTPALRLPRLEPDIIQASEPVANGDNDSNSSSISTSGCSSLIPQAKYQAENNKSSTSSVNNRSSQRRGCFGDRDMSIYLQTSRSMLDGSVPRATAAASSRRPSFNASVFSSPTSPTADAGAGTQRSPFYAGRTQFGGASSYRKPRDSLFTPLEATSPARQTVQVKPLPGSKSMDWGSCTARKILDTLDHLTSPVIDAKRIPSSPALGQSRKRTAREASPGPVPGGPASQELIVPTVQDLLKMQRQNKMRDSMEAARKVALSPEMNPAASLTETERAYRLRLDADVGRPGAGKVTSRMRALEAEMSPAEVRLPATPLPIATLPAFAQPARPPTAAPVASRFSFSRPTPLDSDEFFVKPQAQAAKKPVAINNNSVDIKSRVPAVPALAPAAQFTTFANSVLPREKAGYVEASKTAGQNGKVGFPAAPELRAGSVMDVLGKKPTPPPPPTPAPAKAQPYGAAFAPPPGSWSCDSCPVSNAPAACHPAVPAAATLGFGEQFKAPAGTWECGACLVRNKPGSAVCVSCQTAKPAPVAAKTPVSAAAPLSVATPAPTGGFGGFGGVFKAAAGSWECATCLVRNAAAAAKCAACSAAKPGWAAPGFGSQFRSATGTWECSSCLVPNKESATACIACEMRKPGGSPIRGFAPKPAAPAAAGFGDMFKKAAGSWDCGECMVTNGAGDKCVACESPRPGAAPAPAGRPAGPRFDVPMTAAASAFVFGIDKAGAAAAQPAAISTAGFQFGAASTAAQTTGFSFGIPAAKAAAPAVSVSDPGADRKRKGDDCADDARPPKAGGFLAEPPKNNFTFGSAAKTNGPVGAAAGPPSNLFSFGATGAKAGPGFGGLTPATNSVTSTTNSVTSTTSSFPSTTNSFSATTNSFSPTTNSFASTANSFPSTTNPFTTMANSLTPVTNPFTTATTAAPDTVFSFGSTSQAKQASSGNGSASAASKSAAPFGSGFGVGKEGAFGAASSGFGSLPSPALSFPSAPAGQGFAPAKTSAPSFSAQATQSPSLFSSAPAPFLFGQAAAPKPAQNMFAKQDTLAPMFGQPAAAAPDTRPVKSFNFSAAPAGAASGFGFTAAATGPAVFGFSATATPAGSGFAFGQPAAAAQFNPGAPPKFNFTGGEVPQFTAAGIANPATPGPRRIIKKAVRRAPR